MKTMAALILSLAALAFTAPAAANGLLDSLRAGDQAAALALLEGGADANAAEVNGTTALHWAVHQGNLALVRELIAAGAEVDVTNDYGASPMSEAALLGDAAILQALLEAGADPESPNGDGQTALMVVARSDNLEAARLLLEHGADVNAKEQWRGQNAVIFAAGQSQPEMLRLLLEAGGNPNSASKPNERDRQISAERRFQWRAPGGMTALIYAAREGCLECAQVLVEAGAEIDKGDVENTTPLLTAIINMRFDTARYLMDAGANINKWNFRGENPVYAAVDVNTIPHGGYPDRPSTDTTTSLEILRLLLEAGANPNLQLKLQPTYRHIKDDRGADRLLNIGATPLLRAAKAFDLPAMELLLAHGAHPNLPNREGVTPLMAAAGVSQSSIDTRGNPTDPQAAQQSRAALELLLANGGELHAHDRFGRTALHGAASWGWNEAVEYLVAQGADLKAEDVNGLTPLDAALGESSSAFGRGGGGEVRTETAELIRELLLRQASS